MWGWTPSGEDRFVDAWTLAPDPRQHFMHQTSLLGLQLSQASAHIPSGRPKDKCPALEFTSSGNALGPILHPLHGVERGQTARRELLNSLPPPVPSCSLRTTGLCGRCRCWSLSRTECCEAGYLVGTHWLCGPGPGWFSHSQDWKGVRRGPAALGLAQSRFSTHWPPWPLSKSVKYWFQV